MVVSLRKVQFDRDVVVLEPQRRRAGFNVLKFDPDLANPGAGHRDSRPLAPGGKRPRSLPTPGPISRTKPIIF